MLNIEYQKSNTVEIHGKDGIFYNYKERATIPMEFNKGGKWIGTDFIIDTGASHIVMSTSEAQRLGIDINSKDCIPGYIGLGNGGRVECCVIKNVLVKIHPFPAIFTSVCFSWGIPDYPKYAGREILSKFGVILANQKTCIFSMRSD